MKRITAKYTICGIVILAAILGIICYFWPMPMADTVQNNKGMAVSYTLLAVEDGQPVNASEDYSDITERQKEDIRELLSKCTYRRKFDTLWSDGSFENSGRTELLHIFLYEETGGGSTIILTNLGEIICNGKNYKMRDSQELISRVLEILRGK